MPKFILAVGAIVSLLYVGYFVLAVRWRFQHEKKDKDRRRSESK